jgi:hypothetical protein
VQVLSGRFRAADRGQHRSPSSIVDVSRSGRRT